jgi:hypothetical protein
MENVDNLRRLKSSILGSLKQVEPRPERMLTKSEAEWEEFLGTSLEPKLEPFKYESLGHPQGVHTIHIIELLPGKGLQDIECRLRPVVIQPRSESVFTKTIDA